MIVAPAAPAAPAAPVAIGARFVLVGNPGSERVLGFTRAVTDAGLPAPLVVSWLDLARGDALEAIDDERAILRLESPGESFEVERAFLRRALDRAPSEPAARRLDAATIDGLRDDHGLVLAPRQAHDGFLATLDTLEDALRSRPGWSPLRPLWAVRELFDKRATSERLARAGIPTPRPRALAGSAAELRERLSDEGAGKVWVKLGCGSSASCLGLWSLGPRESFATTLEIEGSRFYNAKHVRRYARRELVDRCVNFLLAEGAHVEDDVDKATIDGRWIDCRVVVVAGEPAFTVVRASRTPITNLHLGATRWGLDALAARCPPDVLERAFASCREAARLYGGLHLGVDLAFTRGFEGHAILEANAFGDHVRRVTRDGLDVHAWELAAMP